MAYATEKDIPHTVTQIQHGATSLGGPMGATHQRLVPRAKYAAGANRVVMAAPQADHEEVQATILFYDASAAIAPSAVAANIVTSFTGADGGAGSKTDGPMVAGDKRVPLGRVGEPAQQDFSSEGAITDTTSI